MERAEREREATEKRADAARDEAEEIAERERDMAEEHDRDQAKQGLRDIDESASPGNEKSQDMRARRDERKEIMGDYRDDERMKAEAASDSTDENANAEEKKGKKPWWKFWGD
jgi:hypothetical protein